MPLAVHRPMTRLTGWLLAALLVVTGAVGISDAARASDDVGTISGTVADESGTPVAGVEVVALRYAEEWGYWQWQSSTTSGEDGAYALADLIPGEYKLQFLPTASTGFVSEWWADAVDEASATPLTLEGAAIITDISPVLMLGGSISGAVTDAGGTPVENVTVTAFQPETMNASASVFTDTAGAYTLAGLPAGEYLVEFQTWNTGANLVGEWWDDAARPENATRVTVAVAEDAGGVDAALALGNSVSGVVTDSDGSPLPSVVVDLFTATGEYVSAAWTDGDGAYTVGGLRDGEYRIRFNPENSSVNVAGEWWDDAATEEDAAVVDLSGGTSLTGISPQLDPAAVLTGTVTDASGAPVAQASVSAYTYDDEAGGWWTWVASATAAEDGTFALGSLRPGSYKIQVTAGTDDVLGEWWPDAPEESGAEVLTLAAGATTGIDVRLEPAGLITGTVTDTTGSPVAGVEVVAYSDGPVMTASTDEAGVFRLGGLRNGTYTVQFQTEAASSEVAGEWWDDASKAADAAGIEVTQGETVSGIDAQLSPGAKVTGTLLDGGGAPLAGASVLLYRDGEENPVARAWTDEDGRYLARGLEAGTYRILAESFVEGLSLREWWNDALTRADADPVLVSEGAAVEGIDLTLAEDGGSVVESYDATLSGRVVDQHGQPIPGALIGIVDADIPAGDGAYTLEDGTWSSFGMAAGRYRVSASAVIDGQSITRWWQDAADKESSDVITLARSEQRTGIDIVLRVLEPPVVESAVPRIAGPPKVGSLLSVHTGEWTEGTLFAYQWFAAGVPIDGATSATYVPTAEQVGQRLTVAVTGSLDGYTSVIEISEPTAPIQRGKHKPGFADSGNGTPGAGKPTWD